MKSQKDIRVLLISPNLLGIRDGINRIQPGLGIMYIAAVLEQRGFQVAIRDTAIEGYDRKVDSTIHPSIITIGESDDSIRDYIADYDPDIVGISVLFYNQAPQVHTVARLVKSVDPNTPVVIGGNQVSERYVFLMEDSNIDFSMVNECDLNFADFVGAYFSNGDYLKTPGLVYRTNTGLHVNDPDKRVENLDELPFPARHLVNIEKYFEIGLFHNPYSRHPHVGHVMASRGCPEKCTFCTTPLRWGKQLRWRSPESVAREIEQLKEVYGIGEIQFEDDSLTLNLKNLEQLCDLIKPFGIVWNTVNGIRPDYHGAKAGSQEKMFEKMAESGCYQVCLGVETGNQDLMDNLIKKRLDLRMVKPCVKAAKKAGISAHVFLIVGFPGETLEDMEKTMDFAEDLGADSFSISIYTPLPGTPLYEYTKNNGYLVPGFSENNILFAKSNIKVPGITPEEFEKQVVEWTNRLNNKLKETDPKKFKDKYGRFLDKNGSFRFKKHS